MKLNKEKHTGNKQEKIEMKPKTKTETIEILEKEREKINAEIDRKIKVLRDRAEQSDWIYIPELKIEVQTKTIIMKLRFITLLLLVSLGLWSCDKSSDELKDECLEVKILNEICGNAVVQILGPKLYEYGENRAM